MPKLKKKKNENEKILITASSLLISFMDVNSQDIMQHFQCLKKVE